MPSSSSASADRPRLGVALLGATGSIGRSTCDVLREAPASFRLVTAASGRDVEGLCRVVEEFRPEAACLADPAANDLLRERLRGSATRVLDTTDRLPELTRWQGVERVVNAVVGAKGLAPSVAALEAGRDLALANKESLVMGGELVMAAAARSGRRVLPIDSEHCSLFQCLEGRARTRVRSVTLTASGGPFRTLPAAEMDALPAAAALQHPTWRMGPRITIDSATLMNKGFEVIEARWLFDLEPNAIEVVVHPQSIVHAWVTLSDGTQIAHLGRPDMRLPIAFALAWPAEPPGRFDPLDLSEIGALRFEPPDRSRFPCLALAERALCEGGTMPAVLNAADEVAVEAYLAGRVRFGAIPVVISDVLAAHRNVPAASLDSILAADHWAREEAARRIAAVEG